MLSHVGQRDAAIKVKNALLCALEDGMHTADIYRDGVSKQKLGTKEFADALIARLGKKPKVLRSDVQSQKDFPPIAEKPSTRTPEKLMHLPPPVKSLVGVDIFLDWEGENRNPDVLAKEIKSSLGNVFDLQMISNRGVKVWPNGHPDTYKVNHWRCRFKITDPAAATSIFIPTLMAQLHHAGLDVIKTENLVCVEVMGQFDCWLSYIYYLFFCFNVRSTTMTASLGTVWARASKRRNAVDGRPCQCCPKTPNSAALILILVRKRNH